MRSIISEDNLHYHCDFLIPLTVVTIVDLIIAIAIVIVT